MYIGKGTLPTIGKVSMSIVYVVRKGTYIRTTYVTASRWLTYFSHDDDGYYTNITVSVSVYPDTFVSGYKLIRIPVIRPANGTDNTRFIRIYPYDGYIRMTDISV